MRRAAQSYRSVDDRRVGTETARPEFTAEQDDPAAAGTVLFRGEGTSHDNRGAEEPKKIGGDSASGNLLRAGRAGQVHELEPMCGNIVDDAILHRPDSEVSYARRRRRAARAF